MPGSELAMGIAFGPDTAVPRGSVWERQVGKLRMMVMVVTVEMISPMC